MQREEIRFMVERDGSAKGIVFSQFTSFLDLIHYSLQKVKQMSIFGCLIVGESTISTIIIRFFKLCSLE